MLHIYWDGGSIYLESSGRDRLVVASKMSFSTGNRFTFGSAFWPTYRLLTKFGYFFSKYSKNYGVNIPIL